MGIQKLNLYDLVAFSRVEKADIYGLDADLQGTVQELLPGDKYLVEFPGIPALTLKRGDLTVVRNQVKPTTPDGGKPVKLMGSTVKKYWHRTGVTYVVDPRVVPITVRRFVDNGTNYYSLIDVFDIVHPTSDKSRYWYSMRERLVKAESEECDRIIEHIKGFAVNGANMTDCATWDIVQQVAIMAGTEGEEWIKSLSGQVYVPNPEVEVREAEIIALRRAIKRLQTRWIDDRINLQMCQRLLKERNIPLPEPALYRIAEELRRKDEQCEPLSS